MISSLSPIKQRITELEGAGSAPDLSKANFLNSVDQRLLPTIGMTVPGLNETERVYDMITSHLDRSDDTSNRELLLRQLRDAASFGHFRLDDIKGRNAKEGETVEQVAFGAAYFFNGRPENYQRYAEPGTGTLSKW